MQLPSQSAICQWLIDNTDVKASDINRARKLCMAESDSDDEVLRNLLRLGAVRDEQAVQAYATLLDAPSLRLDEASWGVEPLMLGSERFLRQYGVVAIATDATAITVAASPPLTQYALDAMGYCAGKTVSLRVATATDVNTLIERLYGQGRSAMDALIESLDESSGAEEDIEHLKDLASEAPVIRLVNLILQCAVEQRASDIHIEPFESQLKVRYRIDGVLHEAEAPPSSSSAAIISRLKIMARLDIAERRLPQDGRIMLRIQGQELDLRVSTVPTSFGESVVMRLLDRRTVSFDFPSLGMDGERLQTFLDVLESPHGILLVTGPTGSGKTTTL